MVILVLENVPTSHNQQVITGAMTNCLHSGQRTFLLILCKKDIKPYQERRTIAEHI